MFWRFTGYQKVSGGDDFPWNRDVFCIKNNHSIALKMQWAVCSEDTINLSSWEHGWERHVINKYLLKRKDNSSIWKWFARYYTLTASLIIWKLIAYRNKLVKSEASSADKEILLLCLIAESNLSARHSLKNIFGPFVDRRVDQRTLGVALASKWNAENFRERHKRPRMKFRELRDGKEETCQSHNILLWLGTRQFCWQRRQRRWRGHFMENLPRHSERV